MNTKATVGYRNEQIGKLKKKFADLTDNDLLFEDSIKEELIGKLHAKLGISKVELYKIIAAH